MNQLYIIGNGFDLAHGMKTKYEDFLTWYLNKVYIALTTIGKFEDDLLSLKNNNGLSAVNIKSVAHFFEMASDSKCETVYKCDFFKFILIQSQARRWVDLEAMYFSQLLILFSNRKNGYDISAKVVALNKDFGFITSLLKEYIASVDIKRFTPNADISNSLTHLFTKHEIGTEREKSALFLNFNYTDTLSLYSDLIERHKARVLHIHGKATDEKDNIIFGYGDEMNDHYVEIEKLNDNEYLRHFKSFNYFNTSNYRNFLNFMEIGLFKVYIMGHSCGLSDRILLNSIFEHKNCSEIQIFYHDKGNGQNDFVEKTYEISRHFSGAKKGEMRARILPFESSTSLVKVNSLN